MDIKSKLSGLILLNKPKGITSHDAVDAVRKSLKIRRVGHAGTLDPLAEGLLIILVGRYTKLFSKFASFDKEYIAVMKLGETTASGDSQGTIISRRDASSVSMEKLKEAFAKFQGVIEQVPPMVSAVRKNGKRLYSLARKGVEVKREPRQINIYKLELLNFSLPLVEFYTKCSKGTYVRKLAEDIGEELGCGAHIVKIIRTSIGPFRLQDAVELNKVDESCLRKVSF